jgi:hypothetical protein
MELQDEINILTDKQLHKLNTKRLLSYYKSIRNKLRKTCMFYCCEFRCEVLWYEDKDGVVTSSYKNVTDEEAKALKKLSDDWEAFVKHVKAILNTREHVN